MATDPVTQLEPGDGCEWCPDHVVSAIDLTIDDGLQPLPTTLILGECGPDDWIRLCFECAQVVRFNLKQKPIIMTTTHTLPAPPYGIRADEQARQVRTLLEHAHEPAATIRMNP